MAKSTKSGQLRSIVKWTIRILLFQFLLMNISASLHAWKFTHFYTDPELLVSRPSSGNIFIKTWKLFSGIRFPRSLINSPPSFPIDTVRFTTADGTNIDSWYSRTDSIARGTVILFHALSTNKKYLVREAAEFRERGFNVLLVDLRGHGNSGGNITSLGYRESEEVKLAYDHIKKSGEKNIFLWGVSLGAVIITKAFNDYDIQPSGVILEMPFACLQSHLEARSRVLGFPEEPFGWLVTAWVGIERGYYGFGLRTTNYVKKINCPVLMQWGNHDKYVLPEETQTIFDNITGTNKRLVIYDGAEHQSLLGYDPEKWKREVGAMLQDPGSIHP
jgi:alpha-beta hydrolase superfamily lysophospholipase